MCVIVIQLSIQFINMSKTEQKSLITVEDASLSSRQKKTKKTKKNKTVNVEIFQSLSDLENLKAWDMYRNNYTDTMADGDCVVFKDGKLLGHISISQLICFNITSEKDIRAFLFQRKLIQKMDDHFLFRYIIKPKTLSKMETSESQTPLVQISSPIDPITNKNSNSNSTSNSEQNDNWLFNVTTRNPSTHNERDWLFYLKEKDEKVQSHSNNEKSAQRKGIYYNESVGIRAWQFVYKTVLQNQYGKNKINKEITEKNHEFTRLLYDQPFDTEPSWLIDRGLPTVEEAMKCKWVFTKEQSEFLKKVCLNAEKVGKNFSSTKIIKAWNITHCAMRMLHHNTYFTCLSRQSMNISFDPWLSLLNHHCDPNCKVVLSVKDETVDVALISLRPIRQNEQLTISYLPSPLDRSVVDRRSFLSSYFNVRCGCSKCQLDIQESLKSNNPEAMYFHERMMQLPLLLMLERFRSLFVDVKTANQLTNVKLTTTEQKQDLCGIMNKLMDDCYTLLEPIERAPVSYLIIMDWFNFKQSDKWKYILLYLNYILETQNAEAMLRVSIFFETIIIKIYRFDIKTFPLPLRKKVIELESIVKRVRCWITKHNDL
jgi:hypothetical protein